VKLNKLLSSAAVKNMWSCTSTPTYVHTVLELCLFKHGKSITLLWQQKVKCVEVDCVLKQKAWQLSQNSATGTSVGKTLAFVTNFSIR